ncbi:MAG: hypothetical protein V4751_00850 [Pseudomonadota bacterium]
MAAKKRTKEAYESKTDCDANLLRKAASKETKLCDMYHIVIENRNGEIVGIH